MTTTIFKPDTVHTAALSELIGIAPDGIVSKPLIETDAIKQVLFAMDAGQELSEHTSSFLATVQVFDGELRFCVNGTSHQLTDGEWLLMPPESPHAVTAVKPSRFLLTLVKRHHD